MRDIFDEIYKNQPLDPMEAARRAMRPDLRKRFYERAEVDVGGGYFRILLDAKPVRTPARRPLAVPARGIAEAIAAEWQAQAERIDPAAMPLTRLANSIIDGVVDAKSAVADEVVKYLGSDLLFYRAGSPEGLAALQRRLWDPLLSWARDHVGARFVLAEGVMHVAQPEEAVAAARAALPQDPWRLGALHAVTTLTGSALLALALSHGAISHEDAWTAAHADEDWQMSQWGRDEMALARRAFRFAEMQAAAAILAQLAPDDAG
ncbi:MAG: ATP12 family chaperone protein [Pseudorhodoplanes sp.]